MTVVSSRDFKTHQKKYLDMALNEYVYIRKGNNMFMVSNADDESKYDYEDLMDAKDCANDETISGTEFIKLFSK